MKQAIVVIFISIGSFAIAKDKETTSRTVTTAKGDVITLSPMEQRGATINGQLCRDLQVSDDKPTLLNGNSIFCHKDHPDLQPNVELQRIAVSDYRRLTKAIDEILVKEKANLPPGHYELKLNNMVVDAKGYIAYYTTTGLSANKMAVEKQAPPNMSYNAIYVKDTNKPLNVPGKTLTDLEKKIMNVISAYQYTPFNYNNEPSAYLSGYTYSFVNNENDK